MKELTTIGWKPPLRSYDLIGYLIIAHSGSPYLFADLCLLPWLQLQDLAVQTGLLDSLFEAALAPCKKHKPAFD